MRFNVLDRLFQILLERRSQRWMILLGWLGVAILIAVSWQQLQPAPITVPTLPAPTATSLLNKPIQPIPQQISLDQNKVKLGEQLFADTRLSADHQVSCLSCHQLQQGGVDRKIRSVEVNQVPSVVNTPTILNVAFNFWFSWDGQFETLEAQTAATIQDEMGSSWEQVLTKLRQVPAYVQTFDAIYSDGVTQANVIDTLVAYQRSLYTPNSRFDQFLRGDRKALTAEEQEGYRLFKSYGCVSCHQGVNLGGNLFQKFGVLGNYFADRGNITSADYGRYNVTGSERDRFVFRVPSLRNVAITSPYFHDGNAKTLEKAIEVMAKYQLGRPLPKEHTRRITQFPNTLTGELPRKSS
jgi:cytochrome c peroxidase